MEQKSTFLRPIVARALGIALLMSSVSSAQAVVVASTLGNTDRPANNPQWTYPNDDFWPYMTERGTSVVYLGDSWVLTAGHVGLPPIFLDGERYDLIPNTSVRVSNPSGQGLTSLADLRLYRINGNPDLPALEIGQTAPVLGQEVILLGTGRARESEPTSWNVQKNGNNWIWNESPPPGNMRGFEILGNETRELRWGTNTIASDDKVAGESDSNNTVIVSIQDRDTVSLATDFTEGGGSQWESQGVFGDSGGPIFHWRNNQWELVGIIGATLNFPRQPSLTAVYGQATTFADLSTYRNQILSIMDNPNYSIVGDLNLDGVVTGDGTGSIAEDDLSAFIQGWGYSQEMANIDSWQKGDLNQDGLTDLDDFRLFRNAFPAAAGIAPALGSAALPEPSSLCIIVLGAGAGAIFVRRMRRTSAEQS